MFSSASSAEWTLVATSVGSGEKFYVDLDRIRKNDGYMYVWILQDDIKPDKYGDMSNKIYREIDCKGFRYKSLTYMFYKQPMGGGEGESANGDNPEWKYPPPDSNIEHIMNFVCAQ